MFRWLTSVKTAMGLILLIVIGSITATILPENLHIYQSFWYRGLLLLFCLNLIFCTVQKIPLVIKMLNEKPKPEQDIANSESFKLRDSSKSEKSILKFFKKEGYQVKSNNSPEVSAIIAQKNRPNLLAPYLLHLSLVIVFLGAFFSSFGVNENISCNVGETVPLPQKLLKGVSIKVEDFKTLYDQSGNIDNWQSTFRLAKQGKLTEPQTVKVNQPFEYEGVKFYQSGYGSGHEVQITGGQELILYQITRPSA